MINLGFGCRWEECLEYALNGLGAEEILYCRYEASWQGDMDIDVLLSDGRVASYHYYYGSCSGCDRWEGEFGYDNETESIANVMLDEMTIFESVETYERWKKTLPDERVGIKEGY